MPEHPTHPLPASSAPGGSPKHGEATLGVTFATGNGQVVVASDALLTQLDALGGLSEVLRLAAGQLVSLLDRSNVVGSIALDVPPAALDARRVSAAALQHLWIAGQLAGNIRDSLVRSLQRYSSAEHSAAAFVHAVDEQVAWAAGQLARTLGVPLAILGVGEVLADCVMTGIPPTQLGTRAQNFLKAYPRILTNPFTVAEIREAAADADGFGAGFAGVPLGVADTLEAAGVIGVPTSAATVVAVGNEVGLLKETPVTVRKTSSFEYGAPPTTLAARAHSFPDAHDDPNGEQIRIDRYVTPGQPDRFDVYVTGTVTFDPKTSTQPFDFTSDLTGVANESPASLRAVEAAMAKAGVTPTSPVVLNGYSQGGLVASLAAASGKYNVKGVVTFGAPSDQVRIPASIPVLSVRNAEDLVPATSGYDTNPHAVVVERSVFDHRAVPSEWAVPAHRLSYYQQTAAEVDRSDSSEVRGVLDPLDAFGAGAHRVDSTLWVADRQAPDAATDVTSLPVRARAEG
jgi:pimeloyl-ACP methyl ester carboxylesterase